jgi:hypothetical protein
MAFARSQFQKPVRVGLALTLLITVVWAVATFLPTRGAPARDAWSVPVPNDGLWAVRSIVREVARFVAFASGRDSDLWRQDAVSVTAVASEAGRDWYRLRVRHGAGETWETELSLVPGAAWDTDAYVPLTKELLRLGGVEAPEYAADAQHLSTLVTLTLPRPEVIQHENDRISKWLQAKPLDARAHAEAALLLATLGWRESAGAFADPRELCHRATAHLVLAQVLRHEGSPSDAFRVAELMVGLVGQSGADHDRRVRRIAARAVAAPVLNPWLAVAEMHRGRDWHAVAQDDNATLLERIELFRAICRTEGTYAAAVRLSGNQFEDVADWTRILFAHEFTVPEGRRFVRFALPFETEEAVQIFPELAGQPVQSAAFAKVLNTGVEPGVTGENVASATVKVIDTGLWAHFLQRHLCHIICRTGDHLRRTAAMPELVPAFSQSMAAVYRHLKLVPLAAVQSGDRDWLRSAAPAVASLLRQHPDWVSGKIWSDFLANAPAEMTRDLPPVAQWGGASNPAGSGNGP